MKKLILGVTGSRNGYPWHRRLMHKQLDLITRGYDKVELRVGDCQTGFDLFATEWAEAHDHKCVIFEARWDKYGKLAGPIRNQNLVDSFYELEVEHAFLGFPIRELPCKGTRGCLKLAEESDLMLVEFGMGLLEGFDVKDISYVASNELAKLQLIVARWEKKNEL